MPQRTLRFRIRQDGRVEEAVEGVVGDSCLQLTEKIEAALGSIESRKPTADAFICKEEQKQSITAEIY